MRQRLDHRVARSSQATSDTVDKSSGASHTKIRTRPSCPVLWAITEIASPCRCSSKIIISPFRLSTWPPAPRRSGANGRSSGRTGSGPRPAACSSFKLGKIQPANTGSIHPAVTGCSCLARCFCPSRRGGSRRRRSNWLGKERLAPALAVVLAGLERADAAVVAKPCAHAIEPVQRLEVVVADEGLLRVQPPPKGDGRPLGIGVHRRLLRNSGGGRAIHTPGLQGMLVQHGILRLAQGTAGAPDRAASARIGRLVKRRSR